LQSKLLVWFAAHKRALPWRADRDPYRVWISEAMLQQTRVEAVLPYFARFLDRFPNLAALAAAPEHDVLAAWSGLGYYRRARTLHATARAIVADHGGSFPRDRESLLALPGIGPYTAGAIASIAFDAREPLVDGNVARVFSRLFALDGAPQSLSAELWSLARELLPRERSCGDWNQALMELGALVCTPRDPRCERCPLRDECRALAEDRVGELPWPKARPSTIAVDLVVIAVIEKGRWLLERRPASGRMADMWQLPTIEVASREELLAAERARSSVADAHATAHDSDAMGRLHPTRWPADLDVRIGPELGAVRHTITRHRIRAGVHRAEIGRASRTKLTSASSATFEWFERRAIDDLALTGLSRKVLHRYFLAILAAPESRRPADTTRRSQSSLIAND
jgi:A/G-specific adenine glycosylase